MLKLKSHLTCSFCSRILKDPIELPCDENICREHLSEKAIVKQNKIKCNECKQDFQVSNNDFKSNKTLKNLIESQSYLSEQEISLKQKLEETTNLSKCLTLSISLFKFKRTCFTISLSQLS